MFALLSLGAYSTFPSRSGLGKLFTKYRDNIYRDNIQWPFNKGPARPTVRALSPARTRRFDSCQVQLRTRSVIFVVGWHFVQGAPFAIPTAPGADLSDRLIARIWPFVIRPLSQTLRCCSGSRSTRGAKVTLRSTPRGAQQPRIRRCLWTGSLGIASCIRLRRSQGPDRDRWLSSFILRVIRPTPPSRGRLISSVRRYIPSGIGLPSRSQIHLPLDSSPDPYLIRAAAYRKFAQCQSD
jgi:hypothetical protein